MSINNRCLCYDASGLKSGQADSVNNYSHISGAHPVNRKGDVIAALGKRKYELIAIAGHAGKNALSVGAGQADQAYNMKTQEITLERFQDSQEFFKVLRKKFDFTNGKPILFLVGCCLEDVVGLNKSLTQQISLYMKDVIVIAPSTLIKPELTADKKLNIKFEIKPGKEAEFDIILTLAAYHNGEKIDDMGNLLNLTNCSNEQALNNSLCSWQ